eukprot:TRINITY_DN13840_c0_g1_i4.p1 TRINITY_DN13840_c0_g1~~TRINITY_DN13840_c0_g1_i4.p1  ORF type:complete len:336 (-),score=17.20 TRINITY_DN13840_c0_g1_i4:177-1184(-)
MQPPQVPSLNRLASPFGRPTSSFRTGSSPGRPCNRPASPARRHGSPSRTFATSLGSPTQHSVAASSHAAYAVAPAPAVDGTGDRLSELSQRFQSFERQAALSQSEPSNSGQQSESPQTRPPTELKPTLPEESSSQRHFSKWSWSSQAALSHSEPSNSGQQSESLQTRPPAELKPPLPEETRSWSSQVRRWARSSSEVAKHASRKYGQVLWLLVINCIPAPLCVLWVFFSDVDCDHSDDRRNKLWYEFAYTTIYEVNSVAVFICVSELMLFGLHVKNWDMSFRLRCHVPVVFVALASCVCAKRSSFDLQIRHWNTTRRYPSCSRVRSRSSSGCSCI